MSSPFPGIGGMKPDWRALRESLGYWAGNLPGALPEAAGTLAGVGRGVSRAAGFNSRSDLDLPMQSWGDVASTLRSRFGEGYQEGFASVPGAQWARARREQLASQLPQGAQGAPVAVLDALQPTGLGVLKLAAAVPLVAKVIPDLNVAAKGAETLLPRSANVASEAGRIAHGTEMEAGVAAAMRERPPLPQMRAAIRHPETGQIFAMPEGQAGTHMDVLKMAEAGAADPFSMAEALYRASDDDMGFVTPSGEYLTRAQATELQRVGGIQHGEAAIPELRAEARAGTMGRGYDEVPDVLRGHRERAELSPLGYAQVYPEVVAAAHERVPEELRRYLTPAQPRQMREAGEVAFSNADTTSGYSLGVARNDKGKVTSVDLRKIWNTGKRGEGTEAINAALGRAANMATQEGVKDAKITLDAFDADGGKLLDKYREMGFVETGRDKYNPDFDPEGIWDDQRPDVVYMAMDPKKVPLIYRRAVERQMVSAPRAGAQGVARRAPRVPGPNTAQRPVGYAPEVAGLPEPSVVALPRAAEVVGPRGELLTASRQGVFPPVYPGREQGELLERAALGGITDPRTWEQNARVIGKAAEEARVGELYPYATQRPGVGGGAEFALPAKAETIARRVAATDERLKANLPDWLKTIERGKRMGGEGWYYQPQFWDALVETAGSKEEAAKVFNLHAALMGPTSAGVDPVTNSMRADMLTGAIVAGHDVGEIDPKKLKIASRYGWEQVRDKAKAMQELYNSGQDPFLAYGPRTKTAQYARAISGELSGVPIDVHMARGALGYPNVPGESVAIHPVEAMRAEQVIAQRARELGQAPSPYMAQGWMGSGPRTGMTNPQLLQQSHQEALLLGAARWGLSPQDYFKRLFSGDIPLSQFRALLPAGVGLGATLEWLRQQQGLRGGQGS